MVVAVPSRMRLILEPCCTPTREASSCSASPVTSDSLSEIASTAVALLPLSTDLQQMALSLHFVSGHTSCFQILKYNNLVLNAERLTVRDSLR